MAATGIKGGEKLMAELKKLAETNGVVRAGISEQAKTPDGGFVAEYAYYNEFGTVNIPARPFMRLAIENNKGKWFNLLHQNLLKGMDAEAVLEEIGRTMQEDIEKSLDSNVPPPNSPATLRQKHSNKTLYDTGLLRKSITYRVDMQ